jgi:hypothetical protein
MVDPWDGSPESHAAARQIAMDVQRKMVEHARRLGGVRQEAIEAMVVRGELPDAIAARLGVSVEDVWTWQNEAMYVGMDFPADLAAVRAESDRPGKRDPATTEAFDGLLRRTFVPTLKQAGFRKTRLVWQRRSGTAWPTIAIRRGRSTGDFLEFWCEWTVRVPGYGARMFPEFPPDPGLDAVLAGGSSSSWSVQRGRFGRGAFAEARLEDAAVVEAEVQRELDVMVAAVEPFDSVAAVIADLDRHELPNLSRIHTRERAVEVLRELEAETG